MLTKEATLISFSAALKVQRVLPSPKHRDQSTNSILWMDTSEERVIQGSKSHLSRHLTLTEYYCDVRVSMQVRYSGTYLSSFHFMLCIFILAFIVDKTVSPLCTELKCYTSSQYYIINNNSKIRFYNFFNKYF